MKVIVKRVVTTLFGGACLLIFSAVFCQAEMIKIGNVYFVDGNIPGESLVFQESGMEMRLPIVVRDAILLDQPNNNGVPLVFDPSEKPKFLDTLIAYSQSADGEYYLVRTLGGKKQWGWIYREFVLEGFEPLRAGDKLHETTVGSIPNPSFIKVVAKNNWRTEGGRRMEAVPILNGPGSLYDTVAQVNIFRIRYAYDLRKGFDGKEYVLVGEEPSLNPYAANSGLSGWIDIDYAILWTSRIGVYYNQDNAVERRDPVTIYKTQEDLQEYLSTRDISKAIAVEDKAASALLSYDTTRFPVIDQSGQEQMKIAFVGSAVNKSDEGVITNQDLSRVRTELNEAIDQVRNQDVLFLIDGTSSMKQHFPAVRNGLQNFMNSILRATEKNRFRFAVAVYRDYQDTNKGFHLLADFGQDVDQYFNSENARRIEADVDYPEAVFQGIIKSVEQASWDKGRTRALVLIGDHGNHRDDIYTEQQVADTLQVNNIALYSINVNRMSQWMGYNRLFDQQIGSILSLSGGIGQNFVVEYLAENDAHQTEVTIEDTLNKIFTFSREVSFGFKDITEGKQIKEVEAAYGTQVTNYLRRIMREQGLNEHEINLANLSQICEDGWVAKKGRDMLLQLQPWVLIDRSSLDELVGIMSGLYKRARQSNPRGLGSAVTEIVKRASGDEINENERVAEFLYRRFHIPFREISDVLQYSPTELEEKFRANPDFKEQFVKRLGKTYAMLQSVQEEKIGNLIWDKDTLRWSKIDPVEKTWWWKTSTGMSFAWIPMDYMP